MFLPWEATCCSALLPPVVGFAVVVVIVVEVVVLETVFVGGVIIATSELLKLVRSTDEFVAIRVNGDPMVPEEMETKKMFLFCN